MTNDNRPWVKPDPERLTSCESAAERTQKRMRVLRCDPFDRRNYRDRGIFLKHNRPEQFEAEFCSDSEGEL